MGKSPKKLRSGPKMIFVTDRHGGIAPSSERGSKPFSLAANKKILGKHRRRIPFFLNMKAKKHQKGLESHEIESASTAVQQTEGNSGAGVVVKSKEPDVSPHPERKRKARPGPAPKSASVAEGPKRENATQALSNTIPASDAEVVSDTMPEFWAERINRAIEKSAYSWVEIGLELISAKEKLQHGMWLKMFKVKMIWLDLRLAQKLMQVARHPALTNTSNLPHLPPSPTALVALSKLPPEAVEDGIKMGRVSPIMTIASVKKFVKSQEQGTEQPQSAVPEWDFDELVDKPSAYLESKLAGVPRAMLENVVPELIGDLLRPR